MAITRIERSIKGLFLDVPSTTITAAASAAASTLTIESIVGFAINKILFIGEPGNEDSEVIKTHSATAPTGTTVTLAANIVFAHSIGTRVYIVDYDQIEFSHAATVAGSKSVLVTQNIQADQEPNIYRDTAQTSGFFFTRYKETIGGTFSSYSDAIPYAGFANNQIGKAVSYAMKRYDVEYSDRITEEFYIDEANRCLTYMHGKLKKWHTLQEFDYALGTITRGVYSFTMPTDSWQFSPRSVLGVRVGSGKNLVYNDKKSWEDRLEGVNHTTLVSSAIIGATTVTLTDSSDFKSAGTIMVAGISITYTANDTATGILTGIPASSTGSITANITAADDVWGGDYEEGEPQYFTVYEGTMYVWPLANATYAGKDLSLDYWKQPATIDSLGDTIDDFRYDAVQDWLTWMTKMVTKNDGDLDEGDGNFKFFTAKLNDAIKLELNIQNQKYPMRPRMNTIKF